ncbi:odorant receptor 4-like [Zerene cesonia]|uniref:odorant receptor 4-like n=1 Tax=Zerene cesonia TaxID=33412 RepID=UPI0018E53A84|nr:odorant receptor 4-like [Zerene cesonia]
MANISDCFHMNFVCLKIFGLCFGNKPNKFYKCYSVIYLFITLPIYFSLLSLNLVFTPKMLEVLIYEFIYYFTEFSVLAKVFMVLRKRNELREMMNLLDCDAFKGDDDTSSAIVNRYVNQYKIYWKAYSILCHFAYISLSLASLIRFILHSNIDLPVCKYYFLGDETLERYYVVFWLYQCIGIYGHMMYNINVDFLIIGLIMMAIAQVEVVHHEISSRVTEEGVRDGDETAVMTKLKEYLKHYEMLLIYASKLQNLISITMFIQLGVASAIICAILCRLSVSVSVDLILTLTPFSSAMILQIFLPAYLGTQLSYKSEELVYAAYTSEWIHRSQSFKSSLNLFMQRAQVKISLTGCGLLPLTLTTFTSIMKTAYSFFTLIRNFQDHD